MNMQKQFICPDDECPARYLIEKPPCDHSVLHKYSNDCDKNECCPNCVEAPE